MGPQALAEATDMSLEEAREFIREYFHDFPKIKDYIEKTKRFAEENGYVETIFGRRRYIPEIHSPNWQMKREAERMAVNMPIQGTATGDIIKMAMIKIDEWIKKEKLEDSVKMLLQVHDELVFEIKKDSLEKAAKEIKKIMESVAELKVPLVVDVKAGANWGEQLLIK
jgi:DNA polymerase-1